MIYNIIDMKSLSKLTLPATFAVLFLFSISCMPDTSEYEEAERQQIDQYIANNPDYTFERKPSGLQYFELIPGTGSVPEQHDTVYVIYTLKLLDGTQIDSNVGKKNLVFPVGEEYWVIEGVDEGVSYMRPGGKSLIILPSELAYGSTGSYPIAGFTPLLFELTLVKIGRSSEKK